MEEVDVAVFKFVEEELGEVEVGLGVAHADVGLALGDGLPDGRELGEGGGFFAGDEAVIVEGFGEAGDHNVVEHLTIRSFERMNAAVINLPRGTE